MKKFAFKVTAFFLKDKIVGRLHVLYCYGLRSD
jgi:hypothetical protein